MRNQITLLIVVLLLITASFLIVMSCKTPQRTNVEKSISNDKIKSVHLMDEVKHGLTKVILDDSTTILIYRGVESCTMLQLK